MLGRDQKYCPNIKVPVFIQRHRNVLSLVLYLLLTTVCLVLLVDPSYLEALLSHILVRATKTSNVNPTLRPPSTPLPKQTLRKLINLPFTPKNFRCEDMLEQAGANFTYLDTYWDHLDAYKTALGLNNLLEQSAANEHAWILQMVARLPFVQTVCETGFDAGATSFQWLVGNEDLVVYSFDAAKSNYSLEMVDFMSIEFPERFFLYPGDVRQTVNTFVNKREGKLKCDVIFLDSTQETEVVQSTLKDFRRLANRVENLVVMDAHPHHSPGSDVHRVWRESTAAGEITEHFKCYFGDLGDIGRERGITVGSFTF